jgi:hypothetical protein
MLWLTAVYLPVEVRKKAKTEKVTGGNRGDIFPILGAQWLCLVIL